MRNHAKWQALVQLEQNRGCRHEQRAQSLSSIDQEAFVGTNSASCPAAGPGLDTWLDVDLRFRTLSWGNGFDFELHTLMSLKACNDRKQV